MSCVENRHGEQQLVDSLVNTNEGTFVDLSLCLPMGSQKWIRVDKRPVGEYPETGMEEFQRNGGPHASISYNLFGIILAMPIGGTDTVA